MKMKLFTSIAAVGLVAAMGTSAMAAVPVGNIVETKDVETVSATLPTDGKSGQMTVIVVKLAAPAEGSETVTVPANISDGDIYYIDQAEYTADNMFANLKLKAGLKVGDYFMVRVGGENVQETGIAEAVYKVVADTPEGPVYTRVKGDVTGSVAGEITLDDASATLQISLDLGEWDVNQTYAADVVGSVDGEVTLDDALAVLQKSLKLEVAFK